jgi:hypothetical protein
MTTAKDNILARWRFDELPGGKQARQVLEQVLGVADPLRTHRTNVVDKNDALSEIGKRDAMREFAKAPEVAGRLYRARVAVEAMRAKLNEQRAKLQQPPTFDKSDAAGAALRGEMRAMLRSADIGERARLMQDPEFAAAALEASDALSGIDSTLRAQAIAAHAELQSPGSTERLAEIEEAISVVDAAYGIAAVDTMQMGGFRHHQELTGFLEASLAEKRANVDAEVSGTFASFGEFAAAA